MTATPLQRLLNPPDTSFFLFGPRAVGKSWWLQQHFHEARRFDLLEYRVYLELSRDPGLLEAMIGVKSPKSWVCIDEVQKIPALLDEVHRLMESKGYRFALSGSSARKLKRGGANLLAGRAITKRMEGLTSRELGELFNLPHALEWGTLPLVCLGEAAPRDTLSTYVHTYIREEIREEGLLRKTEPFVRFLQIAGIMNGQLVNKENIARDAKVPRSTVDTYFAILEDTLLGHFLPAYQPAAKVRERAHPKFYWFDQGVARGAAGLLDDPADPLWLGYALETLIFHELRVYDQVAERNRPLFFYQTGNGAEIDFVIETRKRTSNTKPHIVCCEVKYAKKWRREWEQPMRALAASGKVIVDKMFGIYGGETPYHFDGIDVLPATTFLHRLHKGEVY